MEFNRNEINAQIIAQLESVNDEVIKVIKQGQEEYQNNNKDGLNEKLNLMKQQINNLLEIATTKPTNIRISKDLLRIIDEHKEPDDYVLDLNKSLKQENELFAQTNQQFNTFANMLSQNIEEEFKESPTDNNIDFLEE